MAERELLYYKKFYEEPLVLDKPIPDKMGKDMYFCFGCRTKHCRYICPVYKELRNESYIAYGRHNALLSVAKGLEDLRNLANTMTYCLECNACELRCPNTLFTADFYRYGTTPTDFTRKIRRDLLAQGVKPDGWEEVEKYIAEHMGYFEGPHEEITKWAQGLKLPTSGKTVLFVDYWTAFNATDIARLVAKILAAARVKIAIIDHPGVTNGELLDSDLKKWLEHGKHTIDALKAAGAETVIVINPHEYSYFVRQYPKYLGTLPFEVVFVTDYVNDLVKKGAITFKNSVNMVATYHDPCALNKFCDVWESPRELIKAIPGIEFLDEDHVSQWDYCCGNGTATFRKIHPDIAYRIGRSRLERALDLEAGNLIVSCPHCQDQFLEVKDKSRLPIEIKHIWEVVAEAMGIEK